MNAQYFIDKFEAIPDEKWIVGQLCDRTGACCVLGHCGERRGMYAGTPEADAIRRLFLQLPLTPEQINDKPRADFPQATPKGRILAAIEYIKANEARL